MKRLSALFLVLFSTLSIHSLAQASTYQEEIENACECIGNSMDEFLPLLNGWVAYMEANPGLSTEKGMEGYLSSLTEDEMTEILNQVEIMTEYFSDTNEDMIAKCMEQKGQADIVDDMVDTEEGRNKILKHLKTLDCEGLTAIMKLGMMSGEL
ncbi:MAG: hypothetical protein EP346_06315 [Bacteroidetes bacterium]|nr:MAG: hypothetical protein EP346_06315 [Bacteroidota bacterium]